MIGASNNISYKRPLSARFLRHTHHHKHHAYILVSTQCCPAYQARDDQLRGCDFCVRDTYVKVSKADKISAIGSFLFGYDSGIIGSVISDSYDEFHTYFKNPDPSITGAVVSVFAGGAFCK